MAHDVLQPSATNRRIQAAAIQTRKLCYRKDDRAMLIYGCPENFLNSLTTPTAIVPQNFSWAFVPIDRVNMRTKFEVRSFTCS